MRYAIISSRDLIRIKRWDPEHLIRCVERGGDILNAHRFVSATRTKDGKGLLDLIDKAIQLVDNTDKKE